MKMRKYVVELFGAFFLTLTFCLALGAGLGDFTPLALCGILIAFFYAGYQLSGAHYNPAVSLAIYLRGRLALGELPAYFVSQIIGGILGALVSRYFLNRMGIPELEPIAFRTGPALLAEFLGTIAIVFVYLSVLMGKGPSPGNHSPIGIGFIVLAMTYLFAGISGAVFNPAIAGGVCAAGMLDWSFIWVYPAATLVGAAVATFIFGYLYGPE